MSVQHLMLINFGSARSIETMSTEKAYKTIRDHIVLLQHRRSHLCVHMVVMLDEGFVGHSWLFADEDGCFDDFAEACC
jgi:hypothetical protein